MGSGREVFVQQPSPGRLAGRQYEWNVLRAAAMSLTFASVMAAGLSAAAAGSRHEQFRAVRHEASRSIAASNDFSSAQRPARSRVRIVVRPRWTDEPGTVYGYPPGIYILGPYGILYGPYPIRRARPVVDLGY